MIGIFPPFLNGNVTRNTPQAFSHFTYEASSHSLLVCDVQGVGDMYTDPQVHTMDGNDLLVTPITVTRNRIWKRKSWSKRLC
jgi:hypothetical protein